MKNDRLAVALRTLQWVLGLVILEESVRFAFSPAAAHEFAQTGMPDIIHRVWHGRRLPQQFCFWFHAPPWSGDGFCSSCWRRLSCSIFCTDGSTWAYWSSMRRGRGRSWWGRPRRRSNRTDTSDPSRLTRARLNFMFILHIRRSLKRSGFGVSIQSRPI